MSSVDTVVRTCSSLLGMIKHGWREFAACPDQSWCNGWPLSMTVILCLSFTAAFGTTPEWWSTMAPFCRSGRKQQPANDGTLLTTVVLYDMENRTVLSIPASHDRREWEVRYDGKRTPRINREPVPIRLQILQRRMRIGLATLSAPHIGD